MALEKVGPGALAGAAQADVKMPVSKYDIDDPNPSCLDLQLRRILRRYAISAEFALVIAEHAFLAGRGV